MIEVPLNVHARRVWGASVWVRVRHLLPALQPVHGVPHHHEPMNCIRFMVVIID